MNKTIRNIVIVGFFTVGGGWFGIWVNNVTGNTAPPMQSLGALVWLISPALSGILLRAFGGDGWKDAGFGLNLRSGGWIWYAVAILVYPLVALLTFPLAIVTGAISAEGFAEQGFSAYITAAGLMVAASLMKNIFEEFAWRGYLTPRFAALRMRPWLGYVFTGFIWAAWHVPYYLYFLDRSVLLEHTSLSLPALIGMAFLALPFHAAAYGELRLLSNSTWPAWMMHNFANAISLTLVSSSFVTLVPGFWSAILSPGTEGVLHSLLMGLMGYGLYRYRVGRSVQPA